MATVMIGGRELQVRRSNFGLVKKLAPVRRKKKEARASDDDAALADAIVDTVHCYVGEPLNEGVTPEWLFENLPADPTEIIRAIIKASGDQVEEEQATETQQGEALRQ